MTKIKVPLFSIVLIVIFTIYSLYYVAINTFYYSGNELTFDIYGGCPIIPKKYKHFENKNLIVHHKRKMHIYLLLSVFNEFCIKYDINYILSDNNNGLGSIRFHGLIPWTHHINLNIAHYDYNESINSFKQYISNTTNSYGHQLFYDEYNAYNINILPSNISFDKYRIIFWYHPNITLSNKLIFKISHQLRNIDTNLIFDPIDNYRSYSIDEMRPYFNIVEYHLINKNNQVELLKKCNDNDNILQKIHYKRLYFTNNTNKYCKEIATRFRYESYDNPMQISYLFIVNSMNECLFDMEKENKYLISNLDIINLNKINVNLLTKKSNIISVNDNITFLIGLGSKKVGSTYFGSHVMPILLDFVQYEYFLYDETEFWRKCLDPLKTNWDCSIDSYLKKITHYNINALKRKLQKSKVLLFEKTASYIRTFHVSYYLSYFSYLYNMYFYVIIRNPITRLYSQIYHDWRRINGHWVWPSETKVSQYIIHRIDSFPIDIEYKYFNAIMNELKITNKTTNNNNDLNISKIIKLYKYGFYKMWTHSNVYLPPIFISVYLPQILIWINTFYNIRKQYKTFKQLQFKDHFRIILSEELWQHPVNKAIKLISWVTNTNQKSVIYQQFKHNFKILEKKFDLKKHRNIFGEHKGEQRSWTPKGSDPFKLNCITKLNDFYADSQQRLFWFLRDNPDLKL
eukprot:369844_1